MKKTMSILLILALIPMLIHGCVPGSADEAASSPPPEETPAAETTAPQETSSPTLDQGRTSNRFKEATVLVSIGSTDPQELAAIEMLESNFNRCYPLHEPIRSAFLNADAINALRQKGDTKVDTVSGVLSLLVSEGYTNVTLCPAMVVGGEAYDEMLRLSASYISRFRSFRVHFPLLSSDDAMDQVVDIIADETYSKNTEDTAFVLVGYGSKHAKNAAYQRLQERFLDGALPNYYVGTLNASPGLKSVLSQVKKSPAKRVILLPLTMGVGEDIQRAIAGDEQDSWESVFTSAGYEVDCYMKGLAEYPEIRELVIHAQGEWLNPTETE